jgi:two-component system sensor histidine kinase KdpD
VLRDNATVDAAATHTRAEARRPRSARRNWLGAAVGVAGLAGVTVALVPLRTELSLAGVTLLYLIPVVATAVAGGVRPALLAAVTADLLVNFLFVPPYHTLIVEARGNVIVLVVYILVAATVAVAVDIAARQRATAVRRGVEAELLAQISAAPAVPHSLTHLLEQVRAAYRMTSVALLDDDVVLAQVGDEPVGSPALSVDTPGGQRLAAWGPSIFAEDRSTLTRLAAAAGRMYSNQRLAEQAAKARELADIDQLRASLLNAVGHDLRTPLAGIKAAVSSLRQPDIAWAAHDQAELLATVEESTDRLVALVENLLSLSRLQAGVLSADPRPAPLDAVVAEAVLHTAAGLTKVHIDVSDDLPLGMVDPGLLERVVANLLANAITASPPDRPVRVSGSNAGDVLQLHVIDHGPGLPPEDRQRAFAPFRRLDDHGTTGLGLGLAIARGFTEAMGGTLTPSDTAGGGLTMTITVPRAP